jgi:hypothetical protein
MILLYHQIQINGRMIEVFGHEMMSIS